jgi:type VI secretion system protein ImpB
MSESLQHKLDRVRTPRVHITYDVEDGGKMVARELPFVVGVIADLSGQPTEPLPALKDRKFVNIDRDNFNSVLQKAAPHLSVRVPNRLTADNTNLAVNLDFKHFDDFQPDRVAQQVPPLRELLDMRQRLNELLTKMQGNDKLEQLLGEVLGNTELATQLHQQMKAKEEPKTEESK